MADSKKVRAIAFHLPQFHPVPENDAWWGRGYTEWRKVVQGRPRFRGHYQPHLPADLGFYDLRLPEARQAQADLAREHGVHGFCYYHYWFNGRRILERPVNEITASGQPDFPFCLCWANEDWSRVWDGKEHHVLLGQKYSAEDDVAHLRALLPHFKDPRYLRVEDKPVFLVYRLSRLPEPEATISRWRKEAEAAGLAGLHLCAVEGFAEEHGLAGRLPVDAAVEFAPDWGDLPKPWFRHLRRIPWLRDRSFWARNHVTGYGELRDRMLTRTPPGYLRYPGVTPMWDNSARRIIRAFVAQGSTPELYESWLAEVVRRFQPPHPEKNLVFINAWNEWSEGNHLEPCLKWGRQYLEATRRALQAT